MRVIISKYHAYTNTRGVRYSATDGEGLRVYVATELSGDQAHEAAVRKFCERRGWHGELVGGTIVRDGAELSRAWIFLACGQVKPVRIVIKRTQCERCGARLVRGPGNYLRCVACGIQYHDDL